MKDSGWWYPPFQDRGEFLPLLPRGLAAANEDVMPQSIDAMSEGTQLIEVAGDSVVLIVAGDNTPKPYTDLTGAIMLPALKLSLDGFELRDHSPLRRNPPDDESSVADALPTEVGETQEREGLWFALSTLLPVASGEPPELDQSCLVRV